MSDFVRVRVPGKVNLALRVGGTDADGYHALGTIFQALSLGDEIQAKRLEPGCFRLSFRGEGPSFLPVDDTNLAMRAAKLLADEFAVADAGVGLIIRKRIPVAGGMAGGSADAAGTLVACNALWDCGASSDDLLALGARLGADVPFCLMGGTALGTGRGDILEPLPTVGTYHWTLALSHLGLSTPAVFREFDRISTPQDVTVPHELLDALAVGDVKAVGAHLINDLVPAALALQPALEATLALGLDAGAVGGLVSGSGPTCAFLSETAEQAGYVAEALTVFSGVRAVRQAHGPVAGAHVVNDVD